MSKNQLRDSQGRFLSQNKRPVKQSRFHNLRGPDGKFISAKAQAKPAPKRRTPVPAKGRSAQNMLDEQVTHVALVIDASGSMYSLIDTARNVFNDQLNSIKAEAFRTRQTTKISTYVFEGGHVTPIDVEQFPEAVTYLDQRNYISGGMTNLRDAVGHAIKNFKSDTPVDDLNHSYLLIVVTDGIENHSRWWSTRQISQEITKLQGTDRWTFTFSVPNGHSKWITSNFGVPAGNIQEWDQTVQGTQEMGRTLDGATRGYYAKRATGQSSTKEFFADLSTIKVHQLRQLDDLTKRFKKWQVNKDADITAFVDEKLTSPTVARQVGHAQYKPGNAFYELTKTEKKVQDYKNILIMERSTGKIYGGTNIRAVLGAPTGDLRVKIKNLSEYQVFIESTSANRKLVRGSTLLYRKNV